MAACGKTDLFRALANISFSLHNELHDELKASLGYKRHCWEGGEKEGRQVGRQPLQGESFRFSALQVEKMDICFRFFPGTA